MGKNRATDQTDFYYLGIARGRFTKKLDPEKLPFDPEKSIPEGFRVRTYRDKDDVEKIIHEEIYDTVDGLIESIEITTPSFGGQQLEITLVDDEGEKNIIQTSLVQEQKLGSYAKGFIQRIPYIDPSKEVRLMAYSIPRDDDPDKKNVGIAVYQPDGNDWKKLPTAFNKDNPMGCPEAKLTEGLGGKKSWDFTERNRFLYAQLTNFIDELTKSKIPDDQVGEGEESDLPF